MPMLSSPTCLWEVIAGGGPTLIFLANLTASKQHNHSEELGLPYVGHGTNPLNLKSPLLGQDDLPIKSYTVPTVMLISSSKRPPLLKNTKGAESLYRHSAA